ncbi:cobalt-precorrin 5A hydrolase [Clostridium amazonitimonense]|uniref:cobalt-precorrin 5A hydrolase n=1 Tax=Clostridium amazonitimonense TaxID=1499689 RepID=UPI00050992AE|nr:cobalt-precorrin 5A hydrolase [Clostridium amazonitimonense]
MKLAIVTFTSRGLAIAETLKEHMDLHHYYKKNKEDFNVYELTERLMKEYEGIIFISATGIAVRAIAPNITTKDKDPAVIVIDNNAKYVISLLSGHLGGANDLCVSISKILKAEAVITTATDTLGKTAPDIIAKSNELIIEDLKKAKEISALLVENKKVYFKDEKSLISLPKGYIENPSEALASVIVTNKDKIDIGTNPCLKLIRRDIVLGIGCKKDYSPLEMKKKVLQTLSDYNIDKRSVRTISTVEVKRNERAIKDLARDLECSLNIFSLEEIKKVQYKYEGSNFVEKTIGVKAVAEPVVELSRAKAFTKKLSLEGMTLCIGELEEE